MNLLLESFHSLSPGGIAILISSSVIFASVSIRASGMWRANRRLKKAINAINIGLPYG